MHERGHGGEGGGPRLSFRVGLRRAAELLHRSQLCDVCFAAAAGVARYADVREHLADRPVQVLSSLEDCGEFSVGRKARVELDRRAEVLLGAGQVLAHVEQHVAEAAVGARVVGVELDAALERVVRRLAGQVAEAIVRVRVVRVELEAALERPVRRLAALPAGLRHLGQPDLIPRLAHLGVLLDGRAIRRERLVPLRLLEERLALDVARLRRRAGGRDGRRRHEHDAIV